MDAVELNFNRLPAEIADLKIYGYTDDVSTKTAKRKLSSSLNNSKTISTNQTNFTPITKKKTTKITIVPPASTDTTSVPSTTMATTEITCKL